jgi:hypothetical protein
MKALRARRPAVAPLAHGPDDPPKVAPVVSEPVLGAGWMVLAEDALEALGHRAVHVFKAGAVPDY